MIIFEAFLSELEYQVEWENLAHAYRAGLITEAEYLELWKRLKARRRTEK